MELRVLQYFLAVTREQSISGAAKALHLSQPTLSRQLREMEEELGKQLIVRSNRRITLTDEGMILRKRAEEIMELVRKTENEITLSNDYIAGDITIGAGETIGVRFLAKAVHTLQQDFPDIHLHTISGDSVNVLENLDRGLIDFGLVFGEVDTTKYHMLKIPYEDIWGVLMRRDSDLAKKEFITPEDLWNQPLITSRQQSSRSSLMKWLGKNRDELNIVGTYNLLFNGSLMVEEGMGYALSFDKIINISGDSNLCFRPLKPELSEGMHIIWKKYQIFPKAAEKFLLQMQQITNQSLSS
ncbi:MAG: LysR family transcriptional regulator [Lachnospiraceae bacterium]|nr:LysR family transcriptional regulator [Lachnospiraceae bacterium]